MSIASSRTNFAKEVYRLYCTRSAAQRINPFSYVYFYSTLGYLQSAGLIVLSSTKAGRTYTNRIVPTFDPSILEPVYRLRFNPN